MSEPDTGIYNALNKGVRDAQGEWFYVLGCDDYICHPEVMDRIIAEAGNAEIVCTDVYIGRTEDNKFRRIDMSEVLWRTPYCHQGALMRSEVIRRNHGFDERYRIAADYKLILQCHVAGSRVQVCPGLDYVFASFGIQGTSALNRQEMYREFDQVLAELLDLRSEKMMVYRDRRYLPVSSLLRFLFCKDHSLRCSSRTMFRVAARHYVRLAMLPLVIITRPIRYRKK